MQQINSYRESVSCGEDEAKIVMLWCIYLKQHNSKQSSATGDKR